MIADAVPQLASKRSSMAGSTLELHAFDLRGCCCCSGARLLPAWRALEMADG